jgi:hypothetical protein
MCQVKTQIPGFAPPYVNVFFPDDRVFYDDFIFPLCRLVQETAWAHMIGSEVHFKIQNRPIHIQ